MQPFNRLLFENYLSIQPFWEAKKLHHVILFRESSAFPIAVVYELKAEEGIDWLSCVPGIGLIGIVFSMDPALPRAICCGALNRPKKVPLFQITHALSCQFFPGEFTRILGIPGSELTNTEIALEALVRSGSITEEIANAGSFEASIQIIKRFVHEWEERSRQGSVLNGVTQYIVTEALRTSGNLSITALSEKTGYSTRYLQKIMISHVGLAPKAAFSNIRFQMALRIMTSHPYHSLAEIAQQAGYSDQAYFTKVFREYTGITPAKYQGKLQRLLQEGWEIQR